MGFRQDVWARIERTIVDKGLSFNELEIPRNKNTLTNWRKKQDLKLSDVELLASALGITPHELVTSEEAELEDLYQLVLPFDDGSKRASVDVECAGASLIIRRLPGRSRSSTR